MLGANSPRTTPTTIVINTSGVSSQSSMLSSLNGLDSAVSSPQLDSDSRNKMLVEEDVREVMSTAILLVGTASFSSR